MSHHHHEQNVPRWATYSVLGLIALTFAAVLVTRVNNLSTTPIALATVVTERAFRFEDHDNGEVHVFDSVDDTLVHKIPSQTGHFVRVMLRTMIRERRDNGLQESGSFIVAKRSDGQLTLQDSITGRVIILRAFGITNSDAFGRLLSQDQDAVVKNAVVKNATNKDALARNTLAANVAVKSK